MTKSQWLVCDDPAPMLEALGQRMSQRKLRLFACACCRRVADLFPDDQWLAAVEVAERFADGLAPESELDAVDTKSRASVGAARNLAVAADKAHSRKRTPATANRRAITGAAYSAVLGAWALPQPVFSALEVAANTSAALGGRAAADALRTGVTDRAAHAVEEVAVEDESAAQADLLRDLFTDQFRFVVPDHAWFTSDVMALAGAIYDRHAFDQLPILADALQDAGCDNDDVLNHCRANAAHVRGCWIVDMVLGKV